MNKAEKRACQYTGYCKNQSYKDYLKGYHQAEKDNELTCDDIEIILNAFLDYKIESIKSGKTKKYTDEEYCVEILKQYKDYKERKEKCQ